jgi:nucleoside-diphosphate-sugar epimerase
MNFLVTGGAGYIGVPLIEKLLEKGHKVSCLDRLFFGKDTLSKLEKNSNLSLIRDDIRWFNPELLKEKDIVIDLASLSNDPSGELDPTKTYDINYRGRLRVAKLAKKYGVLRYILASTCSVYGFSSQILDETSQTNPITTYAKSAVNAEVDVLTLSDEKFTVIVPRFATVYGLAPRMRFDLAINAMILKLYKTGKISVMRDGSQWRPFIHVKDVAKAYMFLAEAESQKLNGQIFNIGSNEQNYQLYSLAKILGDSLGKPYEIDWYGDADKRSYRVNFDKVKRLNYKVDYTPERAIKEIRNALDSGEVTDDAKTRTVEWYKHLLDTRPQELILRDTVL